MTEDQHAQLFRTALVRICMFETLKNYKKRNLAILEALHHALEYGYPGGIRIDPEEPEWPVVFIDIGEGQLTWHIEQYKNEWDGHDTDEKYQRINKFLGDRV